MRCVCRYGTNASGAKARASVATVVIAAVVADSSSDRWLTDIGITPSATRKSAYAAGGSRNQVSERLARTRSHDSLAEPNSYTAISANGDDTQLFAEQRKRLGAEREPKIPPAAAFFVQRVREAAEQDPADTQQVLLGCDDTDALGLRRLRRVPRGGERGGQRRNLQAPHQGVREHDREHEQREAKRVVTELGVAEQAVLNHVAELGRGPPVADGAAVRAQEIVALERHPELTPIRGERVVEDQQPVVATALIAEHRPCRPQPQQRRDEAIY